METDQTMGRVLAVTKALADQNRIRALAALRQGELCVCQIIDLLELAPSTVSKHMAVLRQAGLVRARKDGRWNYYRLTGAQAPEFVRRAGSWVLEAAADSEVLRVDQARLEEIQSCHDRDRCGAGPVQP